MAATSALKIQDDKFATLGLTKTIVNKEQVNTYSRNLGSVSAENPVLVLVHGYPSSAFMWRHLIPLLPPSSPIFAPDLPGYGASAPIDKNDKLTVGRTLLAALKTEIKRSSSGDGGKEIPVVLVGHDRGARVAHHVAVEGVEGVRILGVALVDIVPISTQWQHYSSPSTAARQVTGYFHWPLLANVSLATRMITAFGRSAWCTEMTLAWAGKSPSGLAKLEADDALAVYGGFFEQDHTLQSSCEDYKEGASTDVVREEENQAQGKKIKASVLLIYSEAFIGSRFSFPEVWKDWVDEGVKIQSHGLGDGVGHFGIEEAPEESAKAIGEWLKGLGNPGEASRL